MIAGYVALTVAVLMIIQALLYRFMGYRKITYSREYSPHTVFEGETVTMSEKISNSKLLPLPWVRVESVVDPNLVYVAEKKSDDGKHKNYVYGEHNSVFSIAPYSTVTRRYTMLCKKRGYYALRVVNITCQDAFGMSELKTLEAKINAVVVVYPRIAEWHEIGDLSKNLIGDVIVRRWIAEDPFMIRGTREYTPVDPQTKINWKASARTGELIVNEFDYTADIKLMVYLNVDADEWLVTDCDPECIENGISEIAAITQYAVEHGIETAFASNSLDSPLGENRTAFGTGQGHLADIYTQLAACRRTSKCAIHRFLAGEVTSGISDTGILLVTSFVSEEIEEQVEELRMMGNKVEIMLLERTEAGSQL